MRIPYKIALFASGILLFLAGILFGAGAALLQSNFAGELTRKAPFWTTVAFLAGGGGVIFLILVKRIIRPFEWVEEQNRKCISACAMTPKPRPLPPR